MFGFTKREILVLLFLMITFFAGLCVRAFQKYSSPLPQTKVPVLVSHEEKEHGVSVNTTRANSPFEMKVDINTAMIRELMNLPGVGEVLADRIINYRRQNGSFHTINELLMIKGIGEKTLQKLKPYLIIQ